MNKRQAKKRAKQRAEQQRAYSSEYYTTGAEVQSAVNRLNARIRTNVEHFGADSKIVQNMYSMLDALVPRSNIRYNADGIMQIARPYELYKNADFHPTLFSMEHSETMRPYGEIKKEYDKAYQHYRENQEFLGYKPLNIDTYIDIASNIMDILYWAYQWQGIFDEADEILDIFRKKGGHSYDDLLRIKQLYVSGRAKEQEFQDML